MSEFPIVEIGTVARIQSGFSFKSSDWKVDGIPVVKIANVKSGRVDRDGLGFVDERVAEKASTFSLSAGDVLLAMTGYVGEVAVVREQDLPLLLNQRVGRCEPTSTDVDKSFLYYSLSSADTRRQLENLAQGSAQPNLSARDFGLAEIHLPPLAEQRAIADVLGALDDKIESNRRLVDTLRSLIDAEFMAMFGDAQLVGEISTFAAVVDCLHSKKPEKVEHGNQLLQLSNISNDGFLLLENHYPISHSDYARWTANIEVDEGDLVLTNVGRVGALARIPTGVKAALGRNMTAIRGHSSHEQIFLFASLNNEWVRREMIKLVDVGTIMDALNVHAIRRIKVPEASESQLLEFSDVSTPLVYRAERAIRESDALSALRDALLPALLSGRLRVRDVEKVVEGAL